MVLRWFLVYVVVELAAVVGLSYAVGFGWTVLVLLTTFLLGLALAGSQLKRQVRRLMAGLQDPRSAVADSALVAFGTVLVVVPGLVTTTLGVLLLLPPTRPAVRLVLAGLVARRASLVTVARPGRSDYIDGEVVSETTSEVAVPREPEVPPVLDVDPLPLPPRPA